MNPRDLRPTSQQLAAAWWAVGMFAVVAGLACMVTDRPTWAVVALDVIGIVAGIMAVANARGWIRL